MLHILSLQCRLASHSHQFRQIKWISFQLQTHWFGCELVCLELYWWDTPIMNDIPLNTPLSEKNLRTCWCPEQRINRTSVCFAALKCPIPAVLYIFKILFLICAIITRGLAVGKNRTIMHAFTIYWKLHIGSLENWILRIYILLKQSGLKWNWWFGGMVKKIKSE